MVDVASLKAEMARHDITQKELAKCMGISQRTLYNKFKSGIFGSDEMEKMIDILKIDNPAAVFLLTR